MRFERLRDFLAGIVSPTKFSIEIADEVEAYRKAHEVKGTSRPVWVTGRGPLSIGPTEVAIICNAFLDGSLTNWEMQYVCDAIQLLEGVTFASSLVEESVASLTDPEINGEVNREAVMKVRNDLGKR